MPACSCSRLWALAWASACLVPVLAQSQAQPDPQSASISRGQQLVESRCFACHSLDENRVGPALRGVVGRTAGKATGYGYSDALSAATFRWDKQGVQAWLSDPEQRVPGQRMNYRLDQAQDREDVVAYLATLSTGPDSSP